MVLKATANDRRALAPCHDEFRDLNLAFADQVHSQISQSVQKGSVQHELMQMFEETVVSSGQTKLGNCFTSWLTWEDLYKYSTRSYIIGISLCTELKGEINNFYPYAQLSRDSNLRGTLYSPVEL
ncbi:hypothetical protein TNCV_390001 [Trichonephila clavipes]|nr:hypothetical protein TNCV_390001 [Trichonephila clavipes]